MKTPEEISKEAPSMDDIKAMHEAIGNKVPVKKLGYQGVTVGMMWNNASEFVKNNQQERLDPEAWASLVADYTIAGLKEMENRGL